VETIQGLLFGRGADPFLFSERVQPKHVTEGADTYTPLEQFYAFPGTRFGYPISYSCTQKAELPGKKLVVELFVCNTDTNRTRRTTKRNET